MAVPLDGWAGPNDALAEVTLERRDDPGKPGRPDPLGGTP
jgi:hypothetical protein